VRVAKHLATEVAGLQPREAMALTAETIATKRTDPEGQEGLGAFLEKRRPDWMLEPFNPSWIRTRA
jgi:methylglutaconyl-CoA hydratase